MELFALLEEGFVGRRQPHARLSSHAPLSLRKIAVTSSAFNTLDRSGASRKKTPFAGMTIMRQLTDLIGESGYRPE